MSLWVFFFLPIVLKNVPYSLDLHCPPAQVIYPLQFMRRERMKYTSNQRQELEAAFAVNQYPTSSERDQLAKKLGVDESRIQVNKPIWIVT